MSEPIELKYLHPFPGNVRRRNTKKDVADLAANIKEMAGGREPIEGVVVPLVVRPRGGPHPGKPEQYEVVCGTRRQAALALLHSPVAPCIVRRLDNAQAIKVSATENLQRDDLHPIEEADAYHHMLAEAKMDIKDVATIAGRSTSHVHKRLRLNQLPKRIKDAFWNGKHPEFIKPSWFVEIAKLQTDVLQMAAWEYINKELDDIHWEQSLQTLRNWIRQNAAYRLRDAPFKPTAVLPVLAGKKDETHPTCNDCPKRSDKQKDLFDDGSFAASDGAQCLDPACWDVKKMANVQVQLDSGMPGVDNDYDTTERYVPVYLAPDKAPKEKVVILDGHGKGNVVEMVPRSAVSEKELRARGVGEDGTPRRPANVDSSGQRKVYKQEKEDIDLVVSIVVGAAPLVEPYVADILWENMVASYNMATMKLVGKRCGKDIERHSRTKLPADRQEAHTLLWTAILAGNCEFYGEQRHALPNLLKTAEKLQAGKTTMEAIKPLYDTWFDGRGAARPNGRDRYKERVKKAAA